MKPNLRNTKIFHKNDMKMFPSLSLSSGKPAAFRAKYKIGQFHVKSFFRSPHN